MMCKKCGQTMAYKGICTTLVGYSNGPCGRPHDDNCKFKTWRCPDGHEDGYQVLSWCECGWEGKRTCFCHEGEKVDERLIDERDV